MSNIRFGCDVNYSIDILSYDDRNLIKDFKCGKLPLDKYITEDIFSNGYLDCDDGLHYKIVDNDTGLIFGFVSLATSGMFYQVDNYTHVFPAIKIDVFAIDKKYQKMHYDNESLNSNEHYYLSDAIMNDFVCKCIDISENIVKVKYIILYADIDAHRFYIRNGYNDFNQFMLAENNMEINQNIPMYFDLDS